MKKTAFQKKFSAEEGLAKQLTIRDNLLISLTLSIGIAICNFPWATYTFNRPSICILSYRNKSRFIRQRNQKGIMSGIQYGLASPLGHQIYVWHRRLWRLSLGTPSSGTLKDQPEPAHQGPQLSHQEEAPTHQETQHWDGEFFKIYGRLIVRWYWMR